MGDVASREAIKTITFSDHIRPFVINHDATRVYANLNNLLGFEIADVKTGKVIKRIEAPAEMWKAKWGDLNQHFFGHGCPSHGIALTPDGLHAYAGQYQDGISVYDRNPTTGLLTQKSGTSGCITNDGKDDTGATTCAVGRDTRGQAVDSSANVWVSG